MRRAILLAAAVAIILSTTIFSTPSAFAQANKTKFSDDAIDAGVEAGVKYLWSQQQADGSWPQYGEAANWSYEIGPTALAVYALLESGVSPQDERIAKAITWLTTKNAAKIQQSMNPPKTPTGTEKNIKTYEAGLLCNVYNAANRKTNGKYTKDLEALAKIVWDYHNNGGYSYDIIKLAEDPNAKPLPGSTSKPLARPDAFDNSNSQYGLLAVWAAAMSNVEVPKEYWWAVMRHWQDSQCGDGGWNYQGSGLAGKGTMTAAGVASMFVCFDNLFADVLVATNAKNEFKPIQRGLDWFDKNFEETMKPGVAGWGLSYYLYGVERVGLASGYKYFGASDWYKIGATALLESQDKASGSWGGTGGQAVADAGLSLLFLIRGRNAVLFNKLEYDGDWRNRSRDLAMLTKWMSNKFLEKPVNWQIVNFKVPVAEWHDAPILYIAGSTEPKFSPDHVQKLKDYVLQGGTILAVTEGNGVPFTKGIKELAAKLFPQYPLAVVPPDHGLYTAHYSKLGGKPKMSMVSNGVRPLLIHFDTDISKTWQQQNIATEKWAFEAGANLYVYVSDLGRGLRPRGTSLWPEPTQEPPTKTVKIARLENSGNCDPEPLAWERFKLLMGNMHKVKVEITGPIPVSKLAEAGVKLAVMTGTDKYTMSNEDKTALRKFVEGGGTIFIDAAGGSKAFAQSTQELLADMYGMDSLRRLAQGSQIFTLKGFATDKIKYRAKTKSRLGTEPNLRAVLVNDRPAVIFSAEDLTAGLLGAFCMTIEGYDPGEEGGTKPGTAFQIVRNIVLNAAGAEGAVSTSTAPAETAEAPK
jgi:hypothetical protein